MTQCPSSRLRLVAVVVAVVIYTCLATVKSSYFPFCRTLIVCSASYSTPGAADSPGGVSVSRAGPSAGQSGTTLETGRARIFAATESAWQRRAGSEELRGRVQHYLPGRTHACARCHIRLEGAPAVAILGAFGLFIWLCSGPGCQDVFSEDRPDGALRRVRPSIPRPDKLYDSRRHIDVLGHRRFHGGRCAPT